MIEMGYVKKLAGVRVWSNQPRAFNSRFAVSAQKRIAYNGGNMARNALLAARQGKARAALCREAVFRTPPPHLALVLA
jgi:hypothetical protein